MQHQSRGCETDCIVEQKECSCQNESVYFNYDSQKLAKFANNLRHKTQNHPPKQTPNRSIK